MQIYFCCHSLVTVSGSPGSTITPKTSNTVHYRGVEADSTGIFPSGVARRLNLAECKQKIACTPSYNVV